MRVHSPVRYIPAPRIGRARVGIEPSAMKPALRIWSPVHLLGPAYMAPALRTVSPVRLHSPVPIPSRRTGRATGTIQPGKVGQARCSRAPGCLSVSSLQVLLPLQRRLRHPSAQRRLSHPSAQRRLSIPSAQRRLSHPSPVPSVPSICTSVPSSCPSVQWGHGEGLPGLESHGGGQ